MANLRYEVYLDGSISSRSIYLWRATDRDDGLNYYQSVSGVLDLPNDVYTSYAGGDQWHMNAPAIPWGYDYLTSPNVIPDQRVGGLLGLAPGMLGGSPIKVFKFAAGFGHYYRAYPADYEYYFPPPEPNPFGLTDYETNDGNWHYYDTIVRYFLRTIRLLVRWKCGSVYVPLKGRAVRLGNLEANWDLSAGSPYQPLGFRQQGCSLGPAYGSTQRDYALTDDDGIVDYVLCAGIAVGIRPEQDHGDYVWTLAKPNFTDGANEQDCYFSVAQCEILPYSVSDGHYYDQRNVSGWDLDYASDWSASSGMLTVPPSDTSVHNYQQSGYITVMSTLGEYIPAAVTFGPYSGASETDILALPKGSLVDDLREQPGDTGTLPAITDLPLLSSSGYPLRATEAIGPEVAPPEDWIGAILPSGPVVANAYRYRLDYTGNAANTLTGVDTRPEEHPDWFALDRSDFIGGEVATLPYSGTWTASDGSGRSGTFDIWIHEDCRNEVVVTEEVAPPEGAGLLDWALDPADQSWLTDARPAAVDQYVSENLEETLTGAEILAEAVTSPSRDVRADHKHFLAAIQSGAAHVFESLDTDTWATGPPISEAEIYSSLCLRTDPSGVFYSFLIGAGSYNQDFNADYDVMGSVWKILSEDGGETWLPPEGLGITGAGTTPPDARYAHNLWLLAVPKQDGTIRVYRSLDGDTWTDAGEVTTGTYPVLLLDPSGDVLCIYHADGNLYCKRGSWQADDSLAWESAVLIDTGVTGGAAAFINSQKIAVAYYKADTINYRRSLDGGVSWRLGAG